MAQSPLGMGPEQMRTTGYRMVDMLVRHLTDSDAAPLRRASPGEMRRRLAGPAPEEASGFDEVLESLEGTETHV